MPDLVNLTSMEEEMVLEVRHLAETSVANVTPVRPRPVVDVHVRFEVTGRREGLLAQLALVRLFLENKRNHVTKAAEQQVFIL